MCDHDLDEANCIKLYKMAYFIKTNYGPMWFKIKMKPHITHAPEHLFVQTKLLDLLPEDVKAVAKEYVSSNAYYAHPENLLAAMLADDNIHVRKRAVKVILGIRSKSATIRPVRNFKVPTLLYDAEHYYEMIDWEAEVLTEPPLTYRLSDDEIREVATEPLTFPSYNSHTQSIERAIKNVTNAS